jgi:hypothetical protein
MAIGEKLLISIEVMQTEHDRQYWLSRPYITGQETRGAAHAADVLLFPWEKFRDQHDLFPQGTGDFFKYLERKLPESTVAIAIDRNKYKEITLHAHEFRLPSLLVKETLVAIVVSLAVDFLMHQRADPIKDIAQFEILVESPAQPCISVKYKGPVNQLSERILTEVEKCLDHPTSKNTNAKPEKRKKRTSHK